MTFARYSCLPLLPDYRQKPFFDWLEVAATLPITGTEVIARTLPSNRLVDLERVRTALDAKGLRVSQVATTPDLTHPEERVRRDQRAQTEEDIDTAAALGATCVRVTAGQAHPGLGRREGVRLVVDTFARLIEHASQRGVLLTYENHYKAAVWEYPDFSQPADIYLDIITQLRPSGMKVNFDTSNPVILSEDPLLILREVKDLVIHTHCSDRIRAGEYSQAVAGEGVLNFPEIFRTLRRANFQGWLSVEYTGAEKLEGLKRSLGFVRNLWETTLSESPG